MPLYDLTRLTTVLVCISGLVLTEHRAFSQTNSTSDQTAEEIAGMASQMKATATQPTTTQKLQPNTLQQPQTTPPQQSQPTSQKIPPPAPPQPPPTNSQKLPPTAPLQPITATPPKAPPAPPPQPTFVAPQTKPIAPVEEVDILPLPATFNVDHLKNIKLTKKWQEVQVNTNTQVPVEPPKSLTPDPQPLQDSKPTEPNLKQDEQQVSQLNPAKPPLTNQPQAGPLNETAPADQSDTRPKTPLESATETIQRLETNYNTPNPEQNTKPSPSEFKTKADQVKIATQDAIKSDKQKLAQAEIVRQQKELDRLSALKLKDLTSQINNKLSESKLEALNAQSKDKSSGNKTQELTPQPKDNPKLNSLSDQWASDRIAEVTKSITSATQAAKLRVANNEKADQAWENEIGKQPNLNVDKMVLDEKSQLLKKDYDALSTKISDPEYVKNASSEALKSDTNSLTDLQNRIGALLEDEKLKNIKGTHTSTLSELRDQLATMNSDLNAVLPGREMAEAEGSDQKVKEDTVQQISNQTDALTKEFSQLPKEDQKAMAQQFAETNKNLQDFKDQVSKDENSGHLPSSDRVKNYQSNLNNIISKYNSKVDDIHYPKVQEKFSNYLSQATQDFIYQDKPTRALLKKNNGLLNKAIPGIAEGFKSAYTGFQCSKENEGQIANLGKVTSGTVEASFRGTCIKGQKRVFLQSMTFHEKKQINGKTVDTPETAELHVAKATMKDVYHGFDPTSDEDHVIIVKREKGSLGLEKENPDDNKAPGRDPAATVAPPTENKFDKNAYQLTAEDELGNQVNGMIYGKQKVEDIDFADAKGKALNGTDANVGHQKFAGMDLARYTSEQRTPANPQLAAREILSQVARMQANGITHRDIKPANVLIDKKGHARIIDFGSSTWVRTDKDRSRYAVLNGYNHTQEYLRWHPSTKAGEVGLSSQNKEFLAYEKFEKLLMEDTHGKGIPLIGKESPQDAILRIAGTDPRVINIFKEETGQEGINAETVTNSFRRFVSPANDHFQTGIVLTELLSGSKENTTVLLRQLRDPAITPNKKNAYIEEFFSKSSMQNKELNSNLVEQCKTLLKTYDGAPDEQLAKANKSMSVKGLTDMKLFSDGSEKPSAADTKSKEKTKPIDSKPIQKTTTVTPGKQSSSTTPAPGSAKKPLKVNAAPPTDKSLQPKNKDSVKTPEKPFKDILKPDALPITPEGPKPTTPQISEDPDSPLKGPNDINLSGLGGAPQLAAPPSQDPNPIDPKTTSDYSVPTSTSETLIPRSNPVDGGPIRQLGDNPSALDQQVVAKPQSNNLDPNKPAPKVIEMPSAAVEYNPEAGIVKDTAGASNELLNNATQRVNETGREYVNDALNQTGQANIVNDANKEKLNASDIGSETATRLGLVNAFNKNNTTKTLLNMEINALNQGAATTGQSQDNIVKQPEDTVAPAQPLPETNADGVTTPEALPVLQVRPEFPVGRF